MLFGPFEYLILPINGDCCDPKKTEDRIETKNYDTTYNGLICGQTKSFY